MRLQPAGGGARGMFHVEHLVIQDEFHGVRRHFGVIEPFVHDDLVERGIETPKLRTPGARAPAEARAARGPAESFEVNPRDKGLEVVGRAAAPMLEGARAFAADSRNMPARGMR